MTNYTTETYQTKRDILNFAQKVSTGVRKPVMKMTKDMLIVIAVVVKLCYYIYYNGKGEKL